MKAKTTAKGLPRDPALWPDLSDEKWVELHVPRYKKIKRRYEEYKYFLEAVLGAASRKYAPLAIVNARPKSIPSFAEKILRKRALYIDPKDPQPPDPLVRMTDLCGGRVITQTAQEVEQIGSFIKEAFDVDWPNSEDASRRLKPTEFGYRSVHYIVQVNPAKLKAVGIQIPVPRSLLGPVCPEGNHPTRLKAEIQVRTLLEHASADIGHDTLYKTGMKVPDPIQRQFAALAAVLEGADREFDRLLASLNDLKSNFGAWHKPDEVKREMERLRIVLKCEPGNQELAVKIGQLALAIGEQQTALNILRPFEGSRDQGVQRVRGLALTELHWEHPFEKEFSAGVELLTAACGHSHADAETLCALAECHAHRGDDERASQMFRKAIVVDPTEPLSFCRFLEFEVARQRNDAVVRLTEPMIQRVMERCRREIQAGVNLPVAWSCLAIFQLLMKQPFPALESLAQVLTLCGKPTHNGSNSTQPCATGRVLRRTRETVHHLHSIREKLAGFDWFERLLTLALAVLVKDEEAFKSLRSLASWGTNEPLIKSNDTVIILSGGCAREVQTAVDAFRPPFQRAVEGLSFTLLSGGTNMGVSGVAGYVASRSRGKIRALGYLPVGAQADEKRYFKLCKSKSTDFSPLDPLQGWTDLIAAGVNPNHIRLINYAGRQISRVEYAVALALGARVAVIESPNIPAERSFNDPLWQDHPNLVRLPLDAMTIRAFLQTDGFELSEEDKDRFEKAAQMAHADYVKSARPKDPSLQDWEALPDSLKLSNYHQVVFWEKTLREYGLGVRELTKKDKKHVPLNMNRVAGKKGVLRLAETEHGRWNVERFSRGWRYAETKDVENKLNPCLVPWPRLVNINGTNYQPYDIKAICGLPKKLREAGLELFKLT